MSDLMSALVAVVGPDHVATGTALAARATSWIDPSALQGLALVRPRTTAEVAAVLALCHAARQPVMPDLSANAHGTGRELFGLFRRHAATAEAGASPLLA